MVRRQNVEFVNILSYLFLPDLTFLGESLSRNRCGCFSSWYKNSDRVNRRQSALGFRSSFFFIEKSIFTSSSLYDKLRGFAESGLIAQMLS